MAAACEKQVFIWDYRTYKSMAVLKAHKDEVRCLYSLGNCLFSGGKGTPNGGSLLMWDLRMLDNLLPFD
jgi:WD40 repeat protein